MVADKKPTEGSSLKPPFTVPWCQRNDRVDGGTKLEGWGMRGREPLKLKGRFKISVRYSIDPPNELAEEGFDREVWAEVMKKAVQITKCFENEYWRRGSMKK